MSYEQCPKCELRFRNEPELTSHLAADHPEVGEKLAEQLEKTQDERRRHQRRLRERATHATRPRST